MLLPDVNHRTWNDTLLALRDCDLYFWCMVAIVQMNLDHGPWDQSAFWGQLKQGAKEYARLGVVDCPLLLNEMDHIREDFEVAAHWEFDDAELGEEVKRKEVQRSILTVVEKKFPKIAMCRWFALILGLRRYIFEWTLRWIILTYFIVMRGDKRVQKAALVKAAAERHFNEKEKDEAKSSTAQDKEELRTLRKKCDNTCEFVHSMLSNRTLWAKMVCVTEVCMHAERFEHEHAITNVDAATSAQWWASRAADQGLLHIEAILSELRDTQVLTSMGCHSSESDAFWATLSADDPQVQREDDYAKTHGSLTLALAARRLRSALSFYTGYPGRCAALFHEEESVRDTAAKEVLEHARLWEKTKDMRQATMKKIAKRSPFNDAHTQQIYKLLLASGGSVTSKTQAVVAEQFSGITHSEVIEDAFRELRKEEVSKNFRKTVSDTRAWYSLIESSVADVRHKFDKLKYADLMVKPKLLRKHPKACSLGRVPRFRSHTAKAF